MKYAEKLKDPRWQKLRLEIFERDGWNCSYCHDSENTLVAHHLSYQQGKEPWEYPVENFKTLCQPCHDREYEERQGYEKMLLAAIREKGFLVDDLCRIVSGFQKLSIICAPEVTASIIEFIFSDEAMDKIAPMFWDGMHGKSSS